MFKHKLFTLFALMACMAFNTHRTPTIAKEILATTNTITINGTGNEADWATASWQSLNFEWTGAATAPTATDFTGRFKLLHDKNYIYLLAEITDDALIDTYTDPLVDYWKDDCIEIFVDEDGSGGQHRASANAWAYHVSMANNWIDFDANGATKDFNTHGTMARTAAGTTYTWECRFALYPDSFIDGGINTPATLNKGKKIGFMFAYNDRDDPAATGSREHMMGSKDMPGTDKNRGYIDASVFDVYYLK
jgi:hypothetical protein